jgi:hypothetical protein
MPATEIEGKVVKISRNVHPIQNIWVGINLGGYIEYQDDIDARRVRLASPLPSASKMKRVYAVWFGRPTLEMEYVSLLRQEGLKPCSHGASYLLGLAAQFFGPTPEEFHGKDLVAAEPNKDAVFKNKENLECFLGVTQIGSPAGVRSQRRLCLSRVVGGWSIKFGFLAEEL